jgi:hypothetical protein
MRPPSWVVALTAGLLLVPACANDVRIPVGVTSQPGVPPVPPTLVGVRDGTQVVLVDTATGRDLRVLYDALTDFSQSYRAYDGRLGVPEVCCPGPQGTGWISDGATSFAAFDPATGAVDERVELPFRALAATYDASGHHQLFVPIGAGVLWLRSGGTFARIESPGIVLVAW